jgi:hypothetical protein
MRRVHAQRDDSFLAVVETVADPGIAERIFKSRNAFCERQAVLALVEEIFRRVLDVAHGE